MSREFQSGLVSIGMPVYNGALFLDEALSSLMAQDYPGFELIISDNASTDSTEKICRAWAARATRVKYLRHRAGVDVFANFNTSLEAARGEFFMWAADDDLWEPCFVRTLVELLRPDPGAALAFCDFNNFDRDINSGPTYPRVRELPSPDRFTRLWRFLRQKEREGKANLIYGLTRRNALEAAGGFRAWGRGSWGADMLTVFRLLAEGNLVLSEKRLFRKRVSPPRESKDLFPPKPVRPWNAAQQKMRNKLGYLAGYTAIIESLPRLTRAQRLILRFELVRQWAYICVRENGQAGVSSARYLWRPA